MATFYITLSAKSDKSGKSEIFLCFRHGKIFLRNKTHIFIKPCYFHDGCIKIPKYRVLTQEIKDAESASNSIRAIQELLLTSFQNSPKETINKEWATKIIEQYVYPKEVFDDKAEEPEQENKQDLFTLFTNFLDCQDISTGRKRTYEVLYRALNRYSFYKQIELDIDTLSSDTLRDIENFLRNEHTFFEVKKCTDKDKTDEIKEYQPIEEYKATFEKFPETRIPKARGDNYIVCLYKCFRAFCRWCVKRKFTTNNPFTDYHIVQENYGTPYYITLEERNILYAKDLSKNKHLELTRDIFIFQSLIGCRISDLYSLTKDNIINGAIEYIAQKTKNQRPDTIRVPLNNLANEILSKYDGESNALFPFFNKCEYNSALKELFHQCGIVRQVTILNSITGKEEKKSIADLVTSHMARRTFCGNLYKATKNADLVSSLSGHKNGSKAFARYRQIDDEMKIELVNILDKK